MNPGPEADETGSSGPSPEPGPRIGRRIVLAMLGLAAATVVAGRPLADAVSGALASTPARGLLPGGGGFRFYSVVGDVEPRPGDRYRLAVTGRVARPLDLGLAALAALPQTALTRDFQCVTGWRVPGVTWSGVLLRDVLDAAGAHRGAAGVTLRSFDGAYTESLTMEQARRDDVLVATSMLGGAVSHDHGGPVRLLVAPMYGYKSLKWLSAIDVVDRIEPGYWEVRGYDVNAWVGGSNGRDDAPT